MRFNAWVSAAVMMMNAIKITYEINMDIMLEPIKMLMMVNTMAPTQSG
jgi:hypothetical protein